MEILILILTLTFHISLVEFQRSGGLGYWRIIVFECAGDRYANRRHSERNGATVNVSGLGTATFTDSIVIVSTLNLLGAGSAVLILDNTSGTGILLQLGSIFSTYDLRGPLGPLSGTGGVASGSQVTPIFPATAGNLTWATGQPLGTCTFTADTTPEPGALVLLGSGLAATLARRRLNRLA